MIVGLSSLVVPALPRAALAQETTVPVSPVGPPPPVGPTAGALQLSASAGVAEAWNPMSAPAHARLLTSGTGGALGLELGYRAMPNGLLGVWVLGSQLGQAASPKLAPGVVYGASAGISGTWYLRPDHHLDPWIAVGTGWRGEWLATSAGVAAEHGLELARARIGLDFHLTPTVAVGPDVGGSLDLFLTREIPGGAWKPVGTNALGESLFLGVHGTFDTPPPRTPVGTAASIAAARR